MNMMKGNQIMDKKYKWNEPTLTLNFIKEDEVKDHTQAFEEVQYLPGWKLFICKLLGIEPIKKYKVRLRIELYDYGDDLFKENDIVLIDGKQLVVLAIQDKDLILESLELCEKPIAITGISLYGSPLINKD